MPWHFYSGSQLTCTLPSETAPVHKSSHLLLQDPRVPFLCHVGKTWSSPSYHQPNHLFLHLGLHELHGKIRWGRRKLWISGDNISLGCSLLRLRETSHEYINKWYVETFFCLDPWHISKFFLENRLSCWWQCTGSAEQQIASVWKVGKSLPTLAETFAKQSCSSL